MNLGIPVAIIIRFGLDEGIERIYYLSVSYDDYSHTTYAGPFVVGGFKIYGCKVFHAVYA
jgi:hypothetical protein